MSYRQKLLALAAAPVLALTVGCTSSGLSVREHAGRDVSSYVAASYTFSPADVLGSSLDGADPDLNANLTTPASVVVAQVGEVSPPQSLLDTLADRGELFSLVQPVSGVAPPAFGRNGAEDPVRRHLDQMRRGAASMGVDYLIVYGGTLDQNRRGGPLSLLDLTIVGAFIVPSQQIVGEATAAAVVIDVETGLPVATASSDADATNLTASVGAEGKQTAQARRLRDEAIEELTGKIVDRFTKAQPGA